MIANVAKELNILTVAVVTRPFKFEKRTDVADRGCRNCRDTVDSLITIPNEKLLAVLGERTSMLDAFSAANDVLLGAVQGIADLIIRPGMINVDFADVRTVMSEMGMAMMGTGAATGENRARDAAEAAIRSPASGGCGSARSAGDSGERDRGSRPEYRGVHGCGRYHRGVCFGCGDSRGRHGD